MTSRTSKYILFIISLFLLTSSCDDLIYVDECGVQNGDNSSCTDCTGNINPCGDGTTTCEEFLIIEDCDGTCQHFSILAWQGDGVCDDGVNRPLNFNCEAFDFDGGDCE